jgi:hypothetical protein
MNDKGLAQDLKRGQQIKLVLGAGVSRSRGLPLWSDLLRETWRAVNGKDPYAEDTELLDRCKISCTASDLPSDFIDRLDVQRHSLELQLAFERIFDQFRWASVKQLREDLVLQCYKAEAWPGHRNFRQCFRGPQHVTFHFC